MMINKSNILKTITTLLVCVISFTMADTRLQAGVDDPTLMTDHEHYPGMGAFQSVEGCVKFATRGKQTAQDKAIALYMWMLTHQFHLYSPQEWTSPGKTPGAKTSDSDMVVEDANRGRFSYGYGLCGTVHTWNEAYWRALGMAARRRAFPGHTNSEIKYDGSWHAFDTDMAGLVFRPDGVVAGYDDIIKNPAMVKPGAKGLPCYPFAWPSDFNSMKKGWQQVAKSGGAKWWKLYNSGYEGLPGIVQLRSGETLTRYFDRDHFGGPSKRRFWHNQKNGPYRDWTYLNMGTPKHDKGESNSRGNASYCNAEFVYEPNFSNNTWRQGVVEMSANVKQTAGKVKLTSGDGKTASVSFRHFSPYVIAGDPADDKNPMTGAASGGLVVEAELVGKVTVELSLDAGQSWEEVASSSGPGALITADLTDKAKGRYAWRLRFTFGKGAGLSGLKMTTVCQVNQAMYPRLKAGGSKVIYRAAARGVVSAVPNYGLPDDKAHRYEERSMRSNNLKYTQRTAKQRTAFTTTNNKPATIVYKIESPRPLIQVRAAARFRIRVPTPKGSDFHLDLSTDGGKTWKSMAKADIPMDNEYSSGWVYGKMDVSKAKVKSALIRVHLYAGGYITGLIRAECYGLYQTDARSAGGAKLTYAWKENGKVKTYKQNLAAGSKAQTFNVPTGAKIVDEYVRIEVP